MNINSTLIFYQHHLGHAITDTIRLTKIDFDICNSKNSVHYPFPAGERLQKKEK